MILGISHIVRGSTALNGDRGVFEALGWTVSFAEHGLPTADAKRPLMATQSDSQDLVYLRPSVGPALELIHYADAVPLTEPPIQIVLPPPSDLMAVPGAMTTPVANVEPVNGSPIFKLTSPALTGSLWFTSGDGEAATLLHFVSDIARALEFWQTGFGFTPGRVTVSSPDWVTLTLRNPLPQWRITLTVVRRERSCREWWLDGVGIRCLSFVSSALVEDGQALLRAGAEPGTGAMSYTINGRALEVEIFKGPDGVMVELVSIPRDRSKGRW